MLVASRLTPRVLLPALLAGLAAGAGAPAPSSAGSPMGFFVTSTSGALGADLGGLAGADRRCQELAARAGAGGRAWRAHLSAAGGPEQPRVDARDRIGRGPWANAKGVVVARTLDELYGDLSGIDATTALTETGARLERHHDVLTGSDEHGRLAFVGGVPATCGDWTSNAKGVAIVGHHDRFNTSSYDNKRFRRWDGSWSRAHETPGCSRAALEEIRAQGVFYCFASDAPAPEPQQAPAAAPVRATVRRPTFARGLNLNHWVGDIVPGLMPGELYAGAWFDEEDVAWIAAQGFDHLRIHVGGHYWVNREGRLDEARLRPFDDTLRLAGKHGLGVVLTMVSLPGFRAHERGGAAPPDASSPFTDETTRGDAAYLWWLVARRYAGEGDGLRFELLSRPDAERAQDVRAFNREMLAAIRRISPSRVVYLTSHDMSVDTATDVELGDPHTALAVQFWEPEVFTFQFDERLPRVVFPGKVPDLRSLLGAEHPASALSGTDLTVAGLDERVARFAAAVRALPHAREVYVAYFGVLHTADDASAGTYIRAARAAFERHGLSWAVYDYHSGCAVRDEQGQPTRILRALFPAGARG